MSDNVWVNADKTAVVDQFAPGKKWQMRRADAVKAGLLAEDDAKPQQRRVEAFDASKAKAPPTTRKRSSPGKGRGKNADAR